MSSRQEEKERRRQERVAREQAEARAAGRRKRLQMVVGGALATLLVAGAIVGIVLAVSGGDDSTTASAGDGETPAANVQLPPQEISDVQDAAKAAGCTVRTVAYAGAGHSEKEFTPADYNSNPPTSGSHNPSWYEDGIYPPGETPQLGQLVHTLEHGRINIQYKPGTPARVVDQLEALYSEMSDGYHLLLYENTTGMDFAVAATAWTQQLGCPEMNDKVFDAIRTFRSRYIDKGPERVP
jgi:hypothetical protein